MSVKIPKADWQRIIDRIRKVEQRLAKLVGDQDVQDYEKKVREGSR